MTDAEMSCVEKMLTIYMKKVVNGVRADYFRKAMKSYENECLDRITELDELSLSQTASVCGHCGVCPNSKVCEAFDSLTEKQRFIVTQIYFEGFAEHEVGTMLGISQQAVHFNKNKARKKLREILSASRR